MAVCEWTNMSPSSPLVAGARTPKSDTSQRNFLGLRSASPRLWIIGFNLRFPETQLSFRVDVPDEMDVEQSKYPSHCKQNLLTSLLSK
ncbi:hypothetical protein CEXT_660401 [Caerostris extrusa]|uniref:Uncharacterized protein n=1 Tax=Caerostris extrusa TaxID=172846 RepID=A0AAV4RT43_CAEEX|nr:hypothetical protein CEXT_660401 [Caerostris extrusa]